MWDRKKLKSKGSKSFKTNYWQSVVVSLFIVIFASVRGFSRMGEIQTGEVASDFGIGAIIDAAFNYRDTGERMIENYIISRSHATQGILATIINETSNSGSFVYGLASGVNNLIFDSEIGHGIIIIIATILMFLFWFFFQNIIQVGKHRFFLESRTYPKTKFVRILYIYRIRRLGNVAKAMFMRNLLLMLWWLTIIGGIVKSYSYRMAPAILAENPSASWRVAIETSRKMMYGNKWQTFKLDISFLGWMIISFFTFGIASVFFVHPYREATEMELYIELRKNMLSIDSSMHEVFNDDYLTKRPVGKYHAGQKSAENNEYPLALFTVPDRHKNILQNLNAKMSYSLTEIVLLFFSLCFIGYVYEVFYAIVSLGEFVNRGMLYGPWLPIYGCGGMTTLLLLKKLSNRPFAVFLFSFIICGIIEYITSWGLETFMNTKWWDYSGFFFNIQGRICLEQLIIFGLSCTINIYLISPWLAGTYKRIPRIGVLVLCSVLIILFLVDLSLSFTHPNMQGAINI